MTEMNATEATEKKSLNFIEQAVENDLREGKNGGKVQTRFPPEPNGYLHIGHIMVMGHAKCGGFTSLLEVSHSDDEFLNIWMNLACRAKAEVDSSLPGADPDERQRACEMWGVRFSLDNLMGYPWIKSAVDGGELLLHGLYFDMGSGELLYFDAESETYVPMVNACASGTSSVKKR